jgi:hypothetical protein
MVLAVIGAGYGRTGTYSLKAALERLGFGPCHHMIELFRHPEQIPAWNQAVNGAPADWDTLLAGYRSGVDWPTCHFWRELADRYPSAKVVLTVRDPHQWYQSARATAFRYLDEPPPKNDPTAGAQWKLVRKMILEQTFGGSTADEELAIAVFERHNEEVKRAIPDERLLVYEVSQGWKPLCGFLGVPIPDEPFPRVNMTEEFVGRFEAIRRAPSGS